MKQHGMLAGKELKKRTKEIKDVEQLIKDEKWEYTEWLHDLGHGGAIYHNRQTAFIHSSDSESTVIGQIRKERE